MFDWLASKWAFFAAILGSAGLGGLIVKVMGLRLDLARQLTDRIVGMEATGAARDALCEAQLAVLRHRMNNLRQSFDGLLMLVEIMPEMPPERLNALVGRIKEDRARHEQAEALERAAITEAMITAAGRRGDIE